MVGGVIMKKKDYMIAVLSFLLLCLSAGLLIYSGYLRDCYMEIDEPVFIDVGLWVLFVFNFILFVCSVIYLSVKIISKKEYKIFSQIVSATFLICFGGSVVFSCSYYSFASEYKISKDVDYIENEWLEGIRLEDMEELMASAGDDVVVYIGREDCKDCRKFEDAFTEILEKHSVITPTYFTNQDRDGENREKLDIFLSSYDINSVPCVIFISGGKVVEKWEDPMNNISEIETYI